MPLDTPRLLIRPFTLADATTIYRLSREPGIARFIPDQVYRDPDHAADVVRFLIEKYAEPSSGICVQAVVLAATGQLIGHVGLSPARGESEIGYAIGDAHQGQGYATEAVRELVRWALTERALPRVLGIVHSNNLASIRVLEKAGFSLVEEREQELHGRLARVRCYEASATRRPIAGPRRAFER